MSFFPTGIGRDDGFDSVSAADELDKILERERKQALKDATQTVCRACADLPGSRIACDKCPVAAIKRKEVST